MSGDGDLKGVVFDLSTWKKNFINQGKIKGKRRMVMHHNI